MRQVIEDMAPINNDIDDMPSDLDDCEDVQDVEPAVTSAAPCFDEEGNRINKKMRTQEY